MENGLLAAAVCGSRVQDVVVVLHNYEVVTQIPLAVCRQSMPIS